MSGKRIIVFGDVHGCYKALERAIEFSHMNNFQAIFLGDYVDRGYDSVRTLELLMDAKQNNPDWIFLRGNHDQMLLDLIEKKAEMDGIGSLPNGNKFSYVETTRTFNNLKKQPVAFKKKVFIFLKELINYYENENFIFVHNPLRDNSVPLSKKTIEELIWNYELKPLWVGKPFIHGHALVEKPMMRNKGININTGCGYDGYLTGLLIHKDEVLKYYSVSQDGINITSEKFIW